MAGNVWDQFYWQDYSCDEELKLCSFAAQGLWMRMLCIMAKSTPRGMLTVAGRPLNPRELADQVGKGSAILEVELLLEELEANGVFSRDDVTGAIINRRMMRQQHIHDVRSAAGKKAHQNRVPRTKAESHGADVLHEQNGQQNFGKDAANGRSVDFIDDFADAKRHANSGTGTGTGTGSTSSEGTVKGEVARASASPPDDTPLSVAEAHRHPERLECIPGVRVGIEGNDGRPVKVASAGAIGYSKLLPHSMERICRAARINPDLRTFRDWRILVDWLESKYDRDEIILPAIEAFMLRWKDEPITSIRIFDKAVRLRYQQSMRV